MERLVVSDQIIDFLKNKTRYAFRMISRMMNRETIKPEMSSRKNVVSDVASQSTLHLAGALLRLKT